MSNFAIIRMEKFNAGNITGIKIHNHRLKELSNKEIDPQRKDLNFNLIECEDLERKVKSMIKDKGINLADKKKDAVLVNEFVITASPEYMKTLSAEETKRYFEEATKFMQERYKDMVSHAIVHMDETNPHMHL